MQMGEGRAVVGYYISNEVGITYGMGPWASKSHVQDSQLPYLGLDKFI